MTILYRDTACHMMFKAQPASDDCLRTHSLQEGSKLIQFVSLADHGGNTLFDCGLPGYSARLGLLADGSVNRLIVSHADADHFGDASTLKQHFPSMAVLAHPADRPWIENPRLLVQERYDCARAQYGFGYASETLHGLESACGGGVAVTAELKPGMEIEIGSGRWSILHVPGHSPGHIALWDPSSSTLLLGDAVLGFGIPSIDGELAMPPTHQFIADYLRTIDLLDNLPADRIILGHWPVLDGDTFSRLLRDSKDCVHRDLSFLLEQLARKGSVTFAALLDLLNDRFRRWPLSEDVHYFYALYGYIDYLKQSSDVQTQGRWILKA